MPGSTPPTRFVERRSAYRNSAWANVVTITRWLRVSQHGTDLRKQMFPQVSHSLPGEKKKGILKEPRRVVFAFPSRH
ncbi:hypothetical protein GCM10007979_36350 [Nocardioides albus]|uniref:Uncharacterized protein n=1 Tax=Nocardioides albus TaxID=1841 RepID=A0A7W5FAC3_9ACTN|nr:hypothetical protein [Nocardioides albus]GGU33992.1 hypothetical protein GCM10007979_36350 [Nocardioides albus]